MSDDAPLDLRSTPPIPTGRAGVVVDIGPLRSDPGFRNVWLSLFGSAIGRETIRLIIPVYVFVATGSAAAIGVFAALQVVPLVVLALAGGAIADAYDRRTVMLRANLAMVGTSLMLVGMTTGSSDLVGLVIVFGVLHTGLTALEQPVRVAAVPRLVSPERLPAAMSLVSLNFQTSSLVGPAIAGVLLAVGGVPAALAFQAIAYVWAVIPLLHTPALPPEHSVGDRPGFSEVVEGLRFVARHQLILSTFAIDLCAMIFGLSLAVLPVIAIDSLGLGPPGAALLASAMAVGSLIGALLSGWTTRVASPGRAVFGAVLAYLAASAVIGVVSDALVIVLLALGVCGAANVSSAILRSTIVQSAAPDRLRGRVTSTHVLVVTTGPRLGDLRNSAVAQGYGVESALISGALLGLIGVAVIWRGFPDLARYRRSVSV